MDILITIIPIFAVIFLGWLARCRGFIPPEFLAPANRLVFYLAIPAMIFRSIAKASFKTEFNFAVLAATLLSILVVFSIAWGLGLMMNVRRTRLASFIQSSVHGNLGYIGLAVAYYFFGNTGFTRASIIAGFIMILQNFLSVFVLQLYSDQTSFKTNWLKLIYRIVGNPVICSAMAGIIFSLSGLVLPALISRILDILSGLALPLALLLIGASLSIELMRHRICSVAGTGMMKMVLLPGIGFIFYHWLGLAASAYLPGLIMLASPTATISYVMAKEMNGDTDFAVAAITTSTILSSITFYAWLHLAG